MVVSGVRRVPIQSPVDYFDATPAFKQVYVPQSGDCFGILRHMKETFERNLSEAQKDEMANQKAYEELHPAKEAKIAEGQAQIDAVCLCTPAPSVVSEVKRDGAVQFSAAATTCVRHLQELRELVASCFHGRE